MSTTVTSRKLIIQIPCYNEEKVLGVTLASLPRQVAGFDTVEFLVVDDGSRDRTVDVARHAGAHHIVSLPHNQGLARAFMAGYRGEPQGGSGRDRQYGRRQSILVILDS